MAVVAIVEISVHWLLGRGGPSPLLSTYLAADAGGKHFYAGLLDNIAPAAVLGFVNGWAWFPRRSVRAVAAIAVALAVFVAILMPVYSVLVGPEHYSEIWGRASSISDNLLNTFFAFLAVGACTIAGYRSRRDWERKKSSVA